ncbi:DUF1661 domain-containing protein [Porphyromonas gingivalis]|uniref:DUF1661 domain-containing protein n=2 Tax=Porphyromonas gingivalis TaxID=837 RepID=A0AAE9XDF5_PORGN|nr:DUF1661 domain-containing protein [Porphyromonas gingivalis]WCF98366.1 DUF1661 domain-containing protein [Porphyromonas gingivalis]
MARGVKNFRTKTGKKSRVFFKKHVRKISELWSETVAGDFHRTLLLQSRFLVSSGKVKPPVYGHRANRNFTKFPSEKYSFPRQINACADRREIRNDCRLFLASCTMQDAIVS